MHTLKFHIVGKDGYITNLDAWRIEAVKAGGQEAAPDNSNYNDIPPTEGADDLPF